MPSRSGLRPWPDRGIQPAGASLSLPSRTILLLLALASPAFGQTRVLDRAVAFIGGHVLTLSELEFEARVALLQRGGLQAASAPLDDATLRDTLAYTIGQRLEVADADKLQAYPLDEGEVDAALKAFRARFATLAEFDAFLAREEADVQQLAAVLARSLRSARVLDGKLRLKSQVSESEVRAFYDQHHGEMGDAPLEEVRASIRQKLTADRLRRLTQLELAQVRRNSDVRLIAPFARTARETAR